MVKSVTFHVVGDQRLVCENCERRVERLFRKLEGVRQVRAQAGDQCIEVLVDTAVIDLPQLTEQLRVAGYDASVTPP